MVAYVDSSVLLRYILAGEVTLRQAQAFPRIVSSELLEIECRRVLLRSRIEGLLDDETLIQAASRLDEELAAFDLLELDSAVKRRAMEAFPIHVKTLDALHLASALQLLHEEPAGEIIVFSHDRQLNLCAPALGFGAALL
jgi:predicted nucleic acid-binding protein